MPGNNGYGQYCPLAMSCEIVGSRWTLLVLREMLDGSTGFNDISRGVPLMSHSLLSRRLKELAVAGLVHTRSRAGGSRREYRLTEAGQALGVVIRAMAEWGQTWIDVDPSVKNVDPDFLMWDVRRNVRRIDLLPDPFVVQLGFSDAPDGKQFHWLVFELDEIDLCYIEPDYPVDVQIDTDLITFTKIWMGWEDLDQAVTESRLTFLGPSHLIDAATQWLGFSKVASVRKKPIENRILRGLQ